MNAFIVSFECFSVLGISGEEKPKPINMRKIINEKPKHSQKHNRQKKTAFTSIKLHDNKTVDEQKKNNTTLKPFLLLGQCNGRNAND